MSRPPFSDPKQKIVEYRHPKYERKPGDEPNCPIFGRTAKGGFFTGLEIPFDDSSVNGNCVTLNFAAGRRGPPGRFGAVRSSSSITTG